MYIQKTKTSQRYFYWLVYGTFFNCCYRFDLILFVLKLGVLILIYLKKNIQSSVLHFYNIYSVQGETNIV